MQPTCTSCDRQRLAIHKAWTGLISGALVLGFAGYVLTQIFWR